jgi:hypothetical protein
MTKYIGFEGYPNEQIWDSELKQITWTKRPDIIVKDVSINKSSKHWKRLKA